MQIAFDKRAPTPNDHAITEVSGRYRVLSTRVSARLGARETRG